MHILEPFYLWRSLYSSEEDERSPFYGREYSEFEFNNTVYNYYIHPQWDEFGSQTLYLKVIYADYEDGFAIIELIGEWNDCLYEDMMTLKREVIELLMGEGIYKFILLGSHVMNFHYSDDSYYEEWFQEVEDEDGWIALIDFREHVIEDMRSKNLDSYMLMGGKINDLEWRPMRPHDLFKKVNRYFTKRLDS